MPTATDESESYANVTIIAVLTAQCPGCGEVFSLRLPGDGWDKEKYSIKHKCGHTALYTIGIFDTIKDIHNGK